MRKILKYTLLTLKWIIISVVGLFVLVAILFYTPAVQNFALHKVLNSINKGDGMHIEVSRVHIGFPMKIEVDSVRMQTPAMSIAGTQLKGDISLLPLLGGKLKVNYIDIDDAHVGIGTPDSLLYMQASLKQLKLDDTSVGLFSHRVDAGTLRGSNGRISLAIKPDTVPKPKEPSAPMDWNIFLATLQLDSIAYNMTMDPTIVDLQCDLPAATLHNGHIDLAKSTIDIESIVLNSVAAKYIAGRSDSAEAPHLEASEADTVTSEPWLITASQIKLTDSKALYAIEGAEPAAGFNPEYIDVADINIEIDSLMNRGTQIRVPLRSLSATLMSCNLPLHASGVFSMDSTAMHADGFSITTPTSNIGLEAMMGMNTENPPVNANLTASISADDIRRIAPPAAKSIVDMLPPYAPLNVGVNISGRMDNLNIHSINLEMPRYISLTASGTIADYSDLNKASGSISLKGRLVNGNYVKPHLFDAKMQREVNIPPLQLSGQVNMKSGLIAGNLRALTGGGKVALDARWNNRVEGYNVKLALDTFPIQSILPQSGLRNIDATATIDGRGLDFLSPKTTANATLELNHIEIKNQALNNLKLQAALANGIADVKAESSNRKANFTIAANGNISGETMDWTFNGDIRNIDLQAIGLSDTTADGAVELAGSAQFTPAVAATRRTPGRPMALTANIDIGKLYWHMPGEAINGDNINVAFHTADSATTARLTNYDLTVDFASPQPLDTITKRLGWTQLVLDRDIKRRRLAIDTIEKAMPQFTLDISAGSNNIASNYLAGSDMAFKSLNLKTKNDSIFSLGGSIIGFTSGKTVLDTISIGMLQRGSYLLYDFALNNRRGTMDQFAHVDARGYVNADRVSVTLSQQNIEGETGYSLGMLLGISNDTHVKVQFVPFHPIIGYKDWDINRDNFIEYDMATNHIDANLDLHNDVSSLRLYTEHNHTDSVAADDIILQIKDIKLADWIAINPFAPPVTGDLSANLKISWDKPNLNGDGNVSLTDFTYGRKKVGDFVMDIDLATNAAGTIRANTALWVDGRKAITASGNLNDSTSANPFLLDFRMIKFPLSIVNPFLPEGTASLSGTLNGNLDITGAMTSPVLNGSLNFDSTAVNVAILGTPLRFSTTPIPVDSNIVRFNNFAIMGVNDEPLTINGTVDLSELSLPKINLAMKARDMQIVGSQKQSNSQVFGKAFIDFDGLVRGNLHMLNVSADLILLPQTNVTYIMADAVSDLKSRSNQDMVHFVNFADSAAVLEADTIAQNAMMMDIDARLTISNGTTISVYLDPQGNSRVQLQSNGTANFTQDYMGDQRMSGRINLTGGFVRYAVPLIGEKTFNFREGSYVEFNGAMLNPILHIDAYDDIRANVAGDANNSRVVNFNVLLKVDGTLNEMNVVFDLECPDDITIANEIKAMTPEQRANQAMNLLLYGSYKSGGTQTISSASVGANALYSFIQSQLNSWAASNIKGVDISFGINQYDKTVDGANTTAMSYSYRVSKSLFDDRFKIVVGGNYTTDANADENFAQNLIADISFEYMLNKTGTMYVRLFRHTGYESILEGEITQTGVGFVYKKKISSIADMFRRSRQPRAMLPQGSVMPNESTDNPSAASTQQ